MNPMLNYDPIAIHECKVCGHEIEINREQITPTNYTVRCLKCRAVYAVDANAEFVGGVWYDTTKLVRV